VNKNNIKVGLLNYTYGTNGITVPNPTIVNKIDYPLMLSDIRKSKSENLDKLIVIRHWGLEYESIPNKQQIDIAKFLFDNGVDIIIGSHPHVLQRMEYHPENAKNNERLIVYSLGNFVSNQRTTKRDGGAMLKLTLKKQNNKVKICNYGYYLTWVNKPVINNKVKFEIIPCYEYESDNFKDLNIHSKEKMKVFISQSRELFEKENKLIRELN